MTLQQLEYFRILAKVEHFTKASKILSVSQPSLSYAIGQLESELGVLLFDRNGRNIELNSYGKIFLTYVEASLDTLAQGVENINILTKTVKKSVKVGYIYSLTDILLNDILKEFYLDINNETISFDFKTGSNEVLLKDLENGILDIILCVIPPKDNYRMISEQELYLFVSKEHPLSKKNEIKIEDIKDIDFISYRTNTGLRLTTDNIFKSSKISPNIKFEVDECNAALSLISLNVGASIMPIVPGVDFERVSPIKISETKTRRRIYLAWNDNIHRNPNIEIFRDFIVNQYTEESFL